MRKNLFVFTNTMPCGHNLLVPMLLPSHNINKYRYSVLRFKRYFTS